MHESNSLNCHTKCHKLLELVLIDLKLLNIWSVLNQTLLIPNPLLLLQKPVIPTDSTPRVAILRGVTIYFPWGHQKTPICRVLVGN